MEIAEIGRKYTLKYLFQIPFIPLKWLFSYDKKIVSQR